jgi:hypothetical protein
MKQIKIILGFFFVTILVLNFGVRPVKSNSGITLNILTAMAGGNSSESSNTDPVAVETFNMAPEGGVSMQYFDGSVYREFGQTATKYYNPVDGSCFFKTNDPVILSTSCYPIYGAETVDYMPGGTMF